MSNKKKLKNKDGATRIVPMAGKFSNLYGRFKLQVYDNAGVFGMIWKGATA